ncbi:UNVERIFIED_CONTAM: hypothetical protein Sradi_7188000 [Sesamum radiatum]|uniref:Reverse transcriptase domain-containing protein n=1 Tax=Sesamum radiatum TaxID=300843 RepID=A0AAW2ISP8_SESRA
MEVLSLITQQIIDQDGGFSYHWRCGDIRLFQLGFADDLLLFSKAETASVLVFKRALTMFADLSGLHANIQKSHLILSRAALPLRDALLATLDFQEGHLPLRYLGLPLLASRLTIADCQPILRKIDDRIKGWEGIMLSFAGRVQLIKSVLSALQVYWAMAFILPKHIIKEIEKRLRRFLWKGSTDVGYAKVSWQQVCRPTCEGGLGIRDLHALNKGLMSRHLWRIIVADRSSIWVDWIFRYRLRDASIWTISAHTGTWGWRKLVRCGIHCDRPSCIELGMVLPSLFGMTPGMNGAPLFFASPRDHGTRLYPLRLSCARLSPKASGIGPPSWIWRVWISHTPFPLYMRAGIALFGQAQGAASPPLLLMLSMLLLFPKQRFILWLAILHRLSTLDRPWLQHMGTTCVLCQDDLPETHTCSSLAHLLQHVFRHPEHHFPWPVTGHPPFSGPHGWRGKHVVNASLCWLPFVLWHERNRRIFQDSSRTADSIARIVVSEIRELIICKQLPRTVSSRGLYRLWRIPWPVEGEAST